MKTRWTPRSVTDAIRKLHKRGRDISYNALGRSRQAIVSAGAYHFGSYRKAVEAAGIEYGDILRRPRWTRPRIIRIIKEAHRAGKSLNWGAVSRRRDELGRASFASLQRRLFGSWARALHAAGLDADDVAAYRRWDRASIAAELRQLHADGEAINSGDIQKSDPGLHAAALRHFKSFDAALRAGRIDPAQVRKRRGGRS